MPSWQTMSKQDRFLMCKVIHSHELHKIPILNYKS